MASSPHPLAMHPLLRRNDRMTLKREPAAGQVWQHYKGGHYHVVGTAKMESDLKDYVVYRPAGSATTMWLRPLGEFLGETGSADANAYQKRFVRIA